MRCGPASCASVLLSAGWQSDPWGLTLQLANEVDPQDDGTTSDQLLALMAGYGFAGEKWFDLTEADSFLRAGDAVLCLLNNQFLVPRTYPSGTSWNALHWVRILVPLEGGAAYYAYDPLTYGYQPDGTVYQGPVVTDRAALSAAIASTTWPEAGIRLYAPAGVNLNDPR
jgi:hypothetical protein